MRRLWTVVSGVVGLSLLIAACAPPGAPGAPGPGGASKPSGPIKVGFLAPTTGNAAASGQDMINGWSLYWKQNNNRIGNREVQWTHEDTASDPTVALNKARQFVEQQQVDMLVGTLLADEGLAVADYVKTTGTPAFYPSSSADDLTQRARVANVVRAGGWASSQPHHPFGEWAYDQGYRKVMAICVDYAFGHEVCGGFLRTFAGEKGGEMVKQLFDPRNTPDFSSYLAQVPDSGADAVFSIQVGADAPRFVKQWNDFGYVGKIPLLGGEVLFDQSLLRQMGPEAEGMISAGHWAEGRPEKVTQDFVDAYDKTYNQLPSYYAAANYSAAVWISKAAEKLNGDVSNKQAFLDAVKNTEVDVPLGHMKLDAYGEPDETTYVRKVMRRPDGRLWNVPIQTFEAVSQFWKFGPDRFLKQPVYSRDFQGLPSQLKQLGIQ
jgi:branched-chain amino acid transport system substrate-binding protein